MSATSGLETATATLISVLTGALILQLGIVRAATLKGSHAFRGCPDTRDLRIH
ncbi:hypothetical protein RSAG8_13674, partial [Rhizoctonia solani AG-8 WAC10335]